MTVNFFVYACSIIQGKDEEIWKDETGRMGRGCDGRRGEEMGEDWGNCATAVGGYIPWQSI